MRSRCGERGGRLPMKYIPLQVATESLKMSDAVSSMGNVVFTIVSLLSSKYINNINKGFFFDAGTIFAQNLYFTI